MRAYLISYSFTDGRSIRYRIWRSITHVIREQKEPCDSVKSNARRELRLHRVKVKLKRRFALLPTAPLCITFAAKIFLIGDSLRRKKEEKHQRGTTTCRITGTPN